MAFGDKFNILWETKKDKEVAVGIRSEAESIYNQMVELIGRIEDNADIDIDQEIKTVFAELRLAFIDCRTRLLTFNDEYPEFMQWRP